MEEHEVSTRRGTDKIVPTHISHFVIRTNKYRELIHWYKTVFHAEESFSNDQLTFLYYDNEHHRIAILASNNINGVSSEAAGIDHIALAYGSIGELLSTYERLKENNIHPYATMNHGATTSFYYADPDGGQLEFQTENFVNSRHALEYFFSDDFKKNPVGVEVDAERMLAEWKKAPESFESEFRQ